MKRIAGAVSVFALIAAASAEETEHALTHPGWSPDGKTIVFSESGEEYGRVRAVDVQSGDTATYAGGVDFSAGPSFAPSGVEIVFSRLAPGQDGVWEVARMNLARGEVTHLTETRAREAHPQWSPDGNSISFVRFEDGQSDIFILDLASGAEKRITNTPDASETRPKWRADSGALVFERKGGNKNSIVDLDLSTGEQRVFGTVVGDERLSAPSYTPDGSSIVLARGGGLYDGLWLMDVETLKATHLLELEKGQVVDAPVFSPDGAKVAFQMSNYADASALYTINADGSELSLLLDN